MISVKKRILSVILASCGVAVGVMSYSLERNKGIVKADDSFVAFEYSSSALDDNTLKLTNKAIFSESYFKHSSLGYNHNLAKLSLAMAMASSSSAESKDNWGTYFDVIVDTSTDIDNIDPTTARNAYIVDVYKKLGFKHDVYKKYDVSLNDTSDSIAYSIAMKSIKVDGKNYNLVLPRVLHRYISMFQTH